MPDTMPAIVLREAGAAMQLDEQQPMPEPARDQIRIRVRAMGLNPVDYKLAARGWPTWPWPHITGVDAAGEVDAIGPGVQEWVPGDRVAVHADMGGQGVFAAYATVPARVAFRVPAAVPLEQAAALPCAGLTAYLAIHRKFAAVRGDEIALVHAGAGGVGGFAIQLLRRQGVRVVTTCSAENADYVRALGADEVILYPEEDVTARLLEITRGRGADRIVSLVDRDTATADLTERLAFGGHLACVVGMPDLSGFKPFTAAASIHEIALGGAHLSGDIPAQEDLARMGGDLVRLLAEGDLDPLVGDVIAADAIPAGLERLAGRHVRGKIVARGF